MAKYKILAGTASYKPFIFIQDATSSVGAGLASLVYSTAGLTAYYCRDNDTGSTAITLASGALGTYASGGFIAADNTNMPGLYQIGLPNAALAAGANKVTVYLKGAANMVPVVLEIELDGINYQDSVRAGLTALPNASAGSSCYFPNDVLAGVSNTNFLRTALVPTAGMAASGSAGTAIYTTLTAPSANAYKGQVIVYTSGALIGQSHLVQSSTTGANSVLTIFSSLVTSPSSGDTFSLVTGVGQKIVDMLSALGTDSKVLISTNAQTGVNFNNVGQTTNLPANVVQIAGQTASAAGAVTFATGTVSTYAGGDTTGTGTLLGRIGGNLNITGGKVQATIASGDNSDKTGYTLTQTFPTNFSAMTITSSGVVTAADTMAATGAYNTILNNLNATITSRFAASGYTAPPTDYQRSGALVIANLTQIGGQSVSATGAVAFPGLIGTSTYAGGSADANALGILTQASNAASGSALAVAQTTAAAIALSVWNALTTGLTTAGSIGLRLAGKFGVALNSADVTGKIAATIAAGDNSDKTGYTLSQAFPSNFSSLLISGTGSVTAGVVNDKSGYSLLQPFPAGFTSLSVDGSGRVLLQPAQPGVTLPVVTSVTNSVSADLQTIKGQSVAATGTILFGPGLISSYGGGDTSGVGTIISRLGTPAGASIASDILTRLSSSGYTAPYTDYAKYNVIPNWYTSPGSGLSNSNIIADVLTVLNTPLSGAFNVGSIESMLQMSLRNLPSVQVLISSSPRVGRSTYYPPGTTFVFDVPVGGVSPLFTATTTYKTDNTTVDNIVYS